MSIVIFGMQGTSESQGLPPWRNVKGKRVKEVLRMRREDGACLCVCVCGERERENWPEIEDVIEGADKVEDSLMEGRKKGE